MGSRGWEHQLRKNRALIRRAMVEHAEEIRDVYAVEWMHTNWDCLRDERTLWSLMRLREGIEYRRIDREKPVNPPSSPTRKKKLQRLQHYLRTPRRDR